MKKTRNQKRAEAEQRSLERSRRSAQEQLLRLNAKLGTGIGAKRERAKLAILAEQEKQYTAKDYSRGKGYQRAQELLEDWQNG